MSRSLTYLYFSIAKVDYVAFGNCFSDQSHGPVELVGCIWHMNLHALSESATELVNGIDISCFT